MTSETREQRIAGAYAFRHIFNILNEIYAGANPETPQEIGGRVYSYLKEFTDEVERRVDTLNLTELDRAPESLKTEFRRNAIAHIKRAFSNETPLTDLNAQEQSVLRMLEIGHEVMTDVLNGKFTNADAAQNPSQTPDGPS
ncbi:MAG: hypothetical protein ACK4VI_07420 [Alphaproteobacteria bacterium]